VCRKPFLIPHAYLTVWNVINVFISNILSRPKEGKFPKFEGMDISEIIHDDLKNSWIIRRTLYDLLYCDLGKRLHDEKLQITKVIYPYENRTWEKALCLGIREHYPSAHIVGYQHSMFSKMLLNYFFSKKESSVMPFPDRIVTNGKYEHELFVKAGYPKEKKQSLRH